MRLLHVASSYPLFDGDEHAPFMEEMLHALTKRGHEVAILVPRVQGLGEGMRNGIDVIGVPYAPSRLQVWGYGRSIDAESRLRPAAIAVTPIAMVALAMALRREINARRPDVVHLHWLLPQGTLAFAVPHQVPVVVSIHGADVRYATGLLSPMTRRVVDRAKAIVAASTGVIDLVSEVAPTVKGKAVVIPHGANETLFFPRDRTAARDDLGIEHDGPIILGVGRLVPKKGFIYLIESMSLLAHTDAHLHLVGDGPSRADLFQAVSPELQERIHFEGSQSRVRVAQWIAASDLVVIPSIPNKRDVDSGPVVLMEALASGRPVVSSHIGMAPRVVVDGDNGYVVEELDPTSIAQAVKSVLTVHGRMDTAARLSFEAFGGWDRLAENLEHLYATCAPEHPDEA